MADQEPETMAWWQKAQKYECQSHLDYMAENGDHLPSKGFGEFYDDDEVVRQELFEHIKDKVCLEMGCGPCPIITGWTARKRIIVEPLLQHYQQRMHLPGELILVGEAGEIALPRFAGAVDGALITRNCIDHSEDPLLLFDLFLDCGAPGCWLMHWCEIWHHLGVDEGHRQITKDRGVMRSRVEAKGYHIRREFSVYDGETPRNPGGNALDWGCLAIKRN